MKQKYSRRDFIKNLYYAISAGLLLESKVFAESYKYKIHKWTGDDFNYGGHDLRDGNIPDLPKSSSSSKDIVIVGGGLSGLATASYLQDREFLLLEMYDTLGGHSRGGSFRGIEYTHGAAYYADEDGNLAGLVDSLGLSPAKLEKDKDSWLYNNSWISENKYPEHTFYKNLNRIRKTVEKVSNLAGPRLIDAFREEPELRALDKIRMSDLMTGYDPEFRALFDNFYKSSLCGQANQISALSGLYLMEDLFNPTFVLEGGNPVIARALAKKLTRSRKKSLKKGCFVWSIELKENGASIVYSDSSKMMHRVSCKKLVIATPHLVTSRIVSNLSKPVKSIFQGTTYGSYLVANLLLNKRIFNQAYDNWFSGSFDFADISLADTPYLANKRELRSDASVLTVFQPYEPNSLGRAILLRGDRKSLSNRIVHQASKVIPELNNHLEEIVLSRWGHALAVPTPGFFGDIEKLQSLKTSCLYFSHSSSQGIPSAEAAVDGARRVVDRINGKRTLSRTIYSI